MQTLGSVFLGVGATLIFTGAVLYIVDRVRQRKQKFRDYVSGLRGASQALERINHPYDLHGILHFWDKTGNLCKIEIMIDPEMEESDDHDNTWEHIENVNLPPIGSMDQAERFIFSPQAAASYAARGESLDDAVMKMLRAAGRID